MTIKTLVAATILWSIASSATAQRTQDRELTKSEQVTHALSRLTFGNRPGDVERISAMGVDRWIEEQLRPASAPDSALALALAPLPPWGADPTNAQAAAAATPPGTMMSVKDSTGKVIAMRVLVRSIALGTNPKFVAGKIIRAQVAERQLEEVLADFWMNHFSVLGTKVLFPDGIVSLERNAIRPHALGKFRDLLGAVAHSPAMLVYLDNNMSGSDSLHRTLKEMKTGLPAARRDTSIQPAGLNENYARELMELHTLGVDGGYTQQDVIEVARAFTGWTTTAGTSVTRLRFGGPPVTFVFREDMHDAEEKTVLGHTLPAGRGAEDAETVLDILARHPSTAKFIATKLARRFVSDDPPPALIQRAAETFTRTDGDIAEVVRTIVTSPEFFSRAAFRSKVKTPFELVVSTARVLDAVPDTSAKTTRLLTQLGQPIFGRQSPDGWPDYASAWINSGTMLNRMIFGADVAAGRLDHLTASRWQGWSMLAAAPVEQQAQGVIDLVLGGIAEKATRDLLLATQAPAGATGDPGTARLREMLAIALGSPEFQRR